MNEEPPPSDNPKPEPSSIPKFVWVLVALSPSAIIMVVTGTAVIHQANPRWLMPVLVIIDLAVSIVGSAGIFRKSGHNKVAFVIGSIFLGALFALLNAGIGLFGACALGAMR